MASNINPNNIDGSFPIAGQDNSSQGFRDNFTNIKNNFTFAQSEINDLQAKSIVTSALNGQQLVNDMDGTQIIRPQLRAWTQALYDHQYVTGAVSLDFNIANFHKLKTAGSLSLTFINWPPSTGANALGYGIMRVWIEVTDTSYTVQLPYTSNHSSGVVYGTDDLAGYLEGGTLTFDATGNYLFDISSIDGGQTFQIFDLTRNQSAQRDPSFYFNKAVSPSFFVGFNANALPLVSNLRVRQDSITAYGSTNQVSSGALNTATPNVASFTYVNGNFQGELAGTQYYASRGNVLQANVQPINAGDWVAYVRAKGFTGNGTANVYANLGSIMFAATGGSNLANGVGGNVSIWTAPDASTASARLVQAVGIENDQSVAMYGNASIAGYTTATNVAISGALTTGGKRVDTGTMAVLFTGAGPNTFTANAFVDGIIVRSASYATITSATITLPPNPVHGTQFRISTVSPITTTTVNTSDSSAIAWVPTNTFSSGNVGLDLWYNSPTSTWYRK